MGPGDENPAIDGCVPCRQNGFHRGPCDRRRDGSSVERPLRVVQLDHDDELRVFGGEESDRMSVSKRIRVEGDKIVQIH